MWIWKFQNSYRNKDISIKDNTISVKSYQMSCFIIQEKRHLKKIYKLISHKVNYQQNDILFEYLEVYIRVFR